MLSLCLSHMELGGRSTAHAEGRFPNHLMINRINELKAEPVLFYFTAGGGHIAIHNAQVDADAGTYTCSVHNQAGTTEKSVSVSVLPSSAHSCKSPIVFCSIVFIF